MKKIYTLIFVLLTQLTYANWNYHGLGFTQVTDLVIYNDTIYASTYDGLYKHSLSGMNDTNWIPCGMQGRHVVQTFAPNYQTFISLVEIDSTYTTQIYKSTDGGNNFSLLSTDTSMFNPYMFLEGMAHPPGNYDTLYFLNHHMKTFDGGITWNDIYPVMINDRFIAVNPNNGEVIIGGETMMLSAYIQISPDYGHSWFVSSMNNYFAGDNCVHDVMFENNIMYAAGEGVICSTTDGGNNWTQLLNTWSYPVDFSLYNWEIEIGNFGIYVTGSNSSSNKVPLIGLFGFTAPWDTLSIQSFDLNPPDIRSMVVIPHGLGDLLYLGGHGVYSYNHITTSIHETSNHPVRVYPNPANDQLFFNLGKSISQASVSIQNSAGKIIISEKLNESISSLNISNLSSGIYFITVKDENENIILKTRQIKL